MAELCALSGLILVRSRSEPPPRRGFALLITIVLLAFLVLLLVSLATLTQVETQLSANNNHLGQARRNALMALNIALGQVQSLTGPDQRTTAEASLANASAPQPRWIGVYGNKNTAAYTAKPSAIQQLSPALLTWLVSGNENVSFTATTTKASAAFGRINQAPSSIPFTPAAAVSSTDGTPFSAVTALTDTITLAASGTSAPARLLVGANTVGTVDPGADFVVAPTMEIHVPAASLPGFASDATAPIIIGRYAWWVGDEGIKARVNLRDRYLQTGNTADRPASFVTAQRSAIELMTYQNSGATTRLGAGYDFTIPTLDRVERPVQLAFLGTGEPSSPALSATARQRFHDLTAFSQAVLADSFVGGLKKDLTAALAAGSATPADDETLFTPQNPADLGVPTWGQLRSWAQTTASRSNPQPIEPKPTTAIQSGFSPVISMAGLGFAFEQRKNNADQHEMHLRLYPAVVLYNPYTVPLKAADYQIGFAVRKGGTLSFDVKQIVIEGEEADYTSSKGYVSRGTYSLDDCPDADNGQASARFLSFTIKAEDIPAGQSHIYTLAASEDRQSYTATNSLVHSVQGLNRYVTLNTAVVVPPEGSFRVLTGDTGKVEGYKKDQLQVVLAQPGGLGSTGLPTSHWYQAVLDAPPLTSGFRYCCQLPDVFVLTPVPFCPSEPALLLSRLTPENPSTPYFALRVQAVMEASAGNTGTADIGAMGSGQSRWLAHTNIRAPVSSRTRLDISPPFSTDDAGRGNPTHGAALQKPTDYDGNRQPLLWMTLGSDALASSGPGQDRGDTLVESTLFDILPPEGLLSLGQLQHAPLSLFGFYPAYPFGNAVADLRLARDKHYLANTLRPAGDLSTTTFTKPYYDLSWHLNRSMWDRYFVSDVPAGFTQAQLDAAPTHPFPNARMTLYRRAGSSPGLADLRYSGGAGNGACDRAAAHLLVAGGFNINSTSEQAWRAVLGGTHQLPDDPAYADGPGSLAAIAPRFSRKTGSLAWTPSASTRGDYSGNRELALRTGSSADTARLPGVIDELARRIVEEVRLRGPFLSLGDFVNRRIVAASDTAAATGIKGALQRAIDRMDAPYEANVLADIKGIPTGMTAYPLLLDKDRKTIDNYIEDHFLGKDSGEPDGAFMSRSAFNPKFLTQADLLSLLGPALSARSDTFLIRTYGEVVNPLDSAQTLARAWCEAVVQRTPDYLDPADDPWIAPKDAVRDVNRQFGRRYQVVSFRWLTPSDI